jgi:hypothetical protein
MANRKRDKQKHHAEAQPAPARAGQLSKMTRKEYEGQIRVLHGELVAMQEWVKASTAKICIVRPS